MKELYRQYIAALDNQVNILKTQCSPVAVPAEDLLVVLKQTVADMDAKISFGAINNVTLLHMMHQTNLLLKTPYLDHHNNINPDFVKRTNDYQSTLNDMKKEVRCSKVTAVGLALLTAVVVAGIVAASVFTFGAVAIGIKLIICSALMGYTGVMAISCLGGFSFGLFSNGNNLGKLANKMEPLTVMAAPTMSM